jgi:hypothetical protein
LALVRRRRRAGGISTRRDEGDGDCGGGDDKLAADHLVLPELLEGIDYGLPNYTLIRPRKCAFLTKNCAFYIEKGAILNA